ASCKEGADLLCGFGREPLQFKGRQGLPQEQPRFPYPPRDPARAPRCAFLFGQLEQVRLVTRRLLARPLGRRFVVPPDRRQVKLSKAILQRLMDIRCSDNGKSSLVSSNRS